MPSVFSEYVRALDTDREPTAEKCSALWSALRIALISEMQKRGLWNTPPSYLGILSHASWSDGARGPDDPLDELLSECYVFVFVRRLRGLRAQLRVKQDIDGLIFLNIRHFLFDLQKRFDPIGFRVYEALQAAIRDLLAGGELKCLEGDAGAVRNHSLLAFGHTHGSDGRIDAEIDQLIPAWLDELMPSIVVGRGKEFRQVSERLAARLLDLRLAGILAFRFKDLVDPLKNQVRAHWAAIMASTRGELVIDPLDDSGRKMIEIVQPDEGLIDRQRFSNWLAQVDEAVADFPGCERLRLDLASLWQLCRIMAVDPMAADRLPSSRRLSKVLSIPRHRLPKAFEALRQLVGAASDELAFMPNVSRPRTRSRDSTAFS